jgi:hypothetical protein
MGYGRKTELNFKQTWQFRNRYARHEGKHAGHEGRYDRYEGRHAGHERRHKAIRCQSCKNRINFGK